MKEIALLGIGIGLGYILCREKYKAMKAAEEAEHKNCKCCHCKHMRAEAGVAEPAAA